MEDLIKTLLNMQSLVLVPFVLIAINQFLIKSLNMEAKKAIIVNFVLAIPFTVIATWGQIDIFKSILIGILLGTSSGGLYDIKKLFQN